jgi:hypothetical protein
VIIRRFRRFGIKMAEYETYSFGADVEMSHEDLGISTEEVNTMSREEHKALRLRLTEAVLVELDEQLIDEVREASELTAHKRSFILRTITNASSQKPKPKPTPRKATTNA